MEREERRQEIAICYQKQQLIEYHKKCSYFVVILSGTGRCGRDRFGDGHNSEGRYGAAFQKGVDGTAEPYFIFLHFKLLV